ncbi:hypothetical protein SRB5_08460 [Streptomyces sp. RB5]|uniref:Uncharacterized protein n=1 Tax=Streptomyces smaragdinus TaxID=2585196 RepID=A0A7K0CBH3_9ACTN|nr:SRPBCC family protein [Streptomyces smaragdinus]MQY10733.1 hypothetical protein [Streptomyces smaragdinus]
MDTARDRSWPVAELDPVRQLKVLAAAQKQPLYAERHFAVPAADLWAVVSDLEGELPRIVPALRSFTVEERDGERLRARAVSRIGHRELFDVVLRENWCVMQSKVLVSGMAAAPEEDGARFAFFTGLRIPGGGPAGRLTRLLRPGRGERLLDGLQARLDAR